MPNDPITKATNDVILSELQNEQELVRMNRQKNKLKRRMSNLASIQELDNMQNVFPTSNINAFGGRLYYDGGDTKPSDYYLMPTNQQQMPQDIINYPAIQPYGYIPGYDLGWFDDKGNYTNDYRNYVNNLTIDTASKMLNDQYNYYINATDQEKLSDRYKAIQKFYANNPDFKVNNIILNDEQLKWVKEGMLDGKPGYLHNLAFQNMPQTPFSPITKEGEYSPLQQLKIEKLVSNKQPLNLVLAGTNLTTNTNNPNSSETPPVTMPIFDSNLKYAPIGINALSTLYNIASPIDYSEANAYSSIAGNVKPNYISFSPIQNTLRYRSVDPTISLNQVAASNAANKRTLSELAINPLTARAGILANEYAYQLGIGEIMRKALEENWNRRKAVAQEQRTVDAFNSDGRRQAATQNQAEDAAVRALQTNYTAQAAKARAAAKQAKATAIGSGLTTLANNFYNLGVQRDNSGALQWLLNNGYLS